VKIIGVMAGVAAILVSMAEGDSFAANLFSSYEEMACDDFATPQALNSLYSLYERVESEPASSGIIKDVEIGTGHTRYAHTRRIPGEWIPSQFRNEPDWGNRWNDEFISGVDDSASWWDVLAYYDGQNRLQGIEFYGSRYGCFISRKPDMCPPWFSTSKQVEEKPLWVQTSKLIAEKPLYVTIRFERND
jgi:hypothetical protein